MKCTQLSLVSLAVASAFTAPSVLAEEAEPQHRQATEVMVVSGSRLEQSLDSVAGSVVVIDEEAIQRNMSTDFSSLFRNEAAVDVKGGAGKPTSVTIRGIGGNRVMMVKDGVRVNNQYSSPLGPGAEGTGRGLIEVEGLKQVEVVKAAASTMYGSDALGGVVVMNTKDASDYLMGETGYFSANAGYTGLNNEYTAGFTLAHAFGDFEHLVSYQRREGEEQQNYDETLPDSDLTTDSLLVKSKYYINDTSNIQLTLDYLNQQLDRWEQDWNSTGNNMRSIDYDRQTEVFNGSLRYRSDKATVAHDAMDITLYYGMTDQTEHRDYYWGEQGTIGRDKYEVRDYEFTEERYGLASTFSKFIGSDNYGHNITYGVDVEQSEMSRPRDYQVLNNGMWQPSDTDLFAFADTESLRVGGFIQDDILLMDGKLNLVAGLRYDYYRNTPDQQQAADAGRDPANFEQMSEGFWSPKIGMVYHMSDDVSVYAQYAYGHMMPTADVKWGELEIKDGAMPLVKVLPNYDLKSEQSNTLEIGVRGNHRDTSYELTGFYTQVEDFIDWEFVGMTGVGKPDSLEYRYINRKEVTLYGFEAQASHWFSNNFQVFGNIAYTHGEDENGDYLNTVSPTKGTVGANYYTELAGRSADMGLAVRFADKMDRTTDLDVVPGNDFYNRVYTTAGYALVDLTANMELTQNLSLRAGVFNLFDKEYIDYADVAGQAQALLEAAGTVESDLTQPGRYFNVSVKLAF
ncbi:TonB-dependent hemoglobin/transferrin/lactoferrin family receptor [Ferrimonas marina]|uniref:Hemoglobin/transferrin/lactoferrin receptor protein n=1 Tax=Ferrimonas marina TaxID=299255 RepID=A0A1M5VYV1_9GAMM|nr:TonB-dependent hemoglobin/transferrin/lactoferrin family receptor [Ferrimonas marina]SHH80499.1 hemoglobin/transferrin/lactoferrin receptor protein [Ferrimonas marina]